MGPGGGGVQVRTDTIFFPIFGRQNVERYFEGLINPLWTEFFFSSFFGT